MTTYRNFVNGEWIESSSARTVSNLNPADTDDVLGSVRQATREEARTAVEAAADAFHGWRATPAPAWVAGNTVVFKPATLTPATGVRIIEIFEEAGVPPGVLNLIIGAGSDAGDEIINHPAVKAISFTGSNPVGIRLYEQASRRGAKVQCEMGGKNPVVIMEEAEMELAVET